MGLYIIMMGVQGAGKGTQASRLAEKYDIPHISTGDLFRAMKSEDTPLAREVQELMAAGSLIPDETTDRMVDDRLSKDDAQKGVILDGYPRNQAQAEALDAMLKGRGESVNVVLVLELDREIAIKRAEGRRYSQDKKRVYNIYFNPPKNEGLDDVDGLPLVQRADDHREGVTKRIDTFYDQTAPLIEYYEARGLVTKINANQSMDDVTRDIVAAIQATE